MPFFNVKLRNGLALEGFSMFLCHDVIFSALKDDITSMCRGGGMHTLTHPQFAAKIDVIATALAMML